MSDQSPVTKRDLIEGNFQKVLPHGSSVAVSESTGGLQFRTMEEVIQGSKVMSMAGPAIPVWLQGNPGGCWAIILQASQWGFDPLSVARQSYEVNGQIAYMSQLIHALIEKRAPLQKRLRFVFKGEGGERQCTVFGHIRGETEPLIYESPPIAKITPKKSPLWASDPDQQLAYYSSRAWCRRYCPDVLLSVYDREEMEERHVGAANAKDVTASAGLHERLAAIAAANKDRPVEGYAEGGVEKELGRADRVVVADGGYIEEVAGEAVETPAPAKGGRGRGKAAKRTSEAAGEPQEAHHPTSAPPLPRNAGEYVEHVARWLMTHEDEASIEQHWSSERRLRNQCGVTSEERDEIRALVDQRVQAVRS